MLLSGDIGGTKTVLAVFSAESGPYHPLIEKTYPSTHYDSLEEIITTFLDGVNLPVRAACFAIAGPIISDRAKITNLSWVVDSQNLKSTFGWQEIKLLNDLQSVAYAIAILEPGDIHTLNPGIQVAGGNIAVLAPGTGLGEAFLAYHNGRYIAYASEGSHAAFSPVGDLQIGLLKYMNEQGFSHVSYERVCSGRLGIPNIYAYLKSIHYAPEPDWLTQQLEGCEDPTPVIAGAALDQSRSSELASATLDMFVNILGAEAGNMALKLLSSGGIYLGGGIPPRILPRLCQPKFLEAIVSKGRFRDMLSSYPVHVILNAKAALLGAASYGFAQ